MQDWQIELIKLKAVLEVMKDLPSESKKAYSNAISFALSVEEENQELKNKLGQYDGNN